MFSNYQEHLFFQITRAYISVLMKNNEWKVHIFLTIDFCIRNKDTRTFTATI